MFGVRLVFTTFIIVLVILSFFVLPSCSRYEDEEPTAPVVNGETCWQYISYFGRIANVGQGVDLSTPEKFKATVTAHNELYNKQYGQPYEVIDSSDSDDGYFSEYVITYKVIQNSVEVIGLPDNNVIECEKKE